MPGALKGVLSLASEYLKWKYRDVKPDEPVELTPEQRRASWWDYHKWHVVLGVVLLLSLASILSRALGLGVIKPDYQIAYVGSAALPEDTAAALESALSALGTDCNGDGRVIVRLNQYITGSDDAMYAYAQSPPHMSDVDSCDSYFFLLDDPEGFQDTYSVLSLVDGSLPENGKDGPVCLSWSDCPALGALALGGYSEFLLGEELKGDSQELLSGLFLARRGFWTDKTSAYPEQCGALWDVITKGAVS